MEIGVDWITAEQAAELMSQAHTYPVSKQYVRLLGQMGHIQSQRIGRRLHVYNTADCRRYKINQREREAVAG